MNVAVGNDGRAELVVGSGAGRAPLVRTFDGLGVMTGQFVPYAASFMGGVRVATGDVNGDGVADLVTGTGPGGGQAKIFDGVTRQELSAFTPLGTAYTAGLNVAMGDVNGDSMADIIVGADSTAGPKVRVFDGLTLNVVMDFFAFDASFLGGVSVAATDVDGDGLNDVVVGTLSDNSQIRRSADCPAGRC